ncbi:hypothetical protein MD484_g401, partial [Candolleomyces efflorescens]
MPESQLIDYHDAVQATDVRVNWMDMCKDIHRYVFGVMSLVTAVCIGATSRYHQKLYKEQAMERVCNWLMEFGLPPIPTIMMMKQIRAVISGSWVLALIEPGLFQPADLDLYVPQGAMTVLEQFLSDTGGFIEVFKDKSKTKSAEYTGWRVTSITRVRYFKHEPTDTTLNVIETESSAPTAVFMFHSTFIMNYVTWNTLVCSYPRSTCDHRGLVSSDTTDMPPRTQTNIIKYIRRGFKIEHSPSKCDKQHTCGASAHCPDTLRSVTDADTMRSTFLNTDDNTPDLVDPTVEWKLASCRACRPEEAPVSKSGYVGNSSFSATVTDLTGDDEGEGSVYVSE